MEDVVLTFQGIKDNRSITIPYYELVNETGKTINLKDIKN